jgi:hypothetical protein
LLLPVETGRSFFHCAVIIDNEQNLPVEIDFDMSIACIPRFWSAGAHDRFKVSARKLSRRFATLILLKRDQRIAS